MYGEITKAKGNLDFLRSEWVVGTVLSVDRTNFGGQLAYGEGVALVYARSAASSVHLRGSESHIGWQIDWWWRQI